MTDYTALHPSSVSLEYLVDLFLFRGIPRNRDRRRPVTVLVNHGHVIGFSPARMQAVWAAYRVAGSKRDVDYDRPHLYYDDRRLAPDQRIGPETFGEGYDVGHLVPNEVINRQFGRLAQMETFLMSNMSPQRRGLNRGIWLRLERKIMNIEDTAGRDHVWAITGPIFGRNPNVLSRPNGTQVTLPEAYYCITVDPHTYPWDHPRNFDVACFLIPQEAEAGTPLEDYLVGLDEIEDATDLRFLSLDSEAEAVAVDSGLGLAHADSYHRHRLLKQLDEE